MKLCTNDVEIFLHFHAFLRADSGMGSLLTPVFTSRKNPTELPVVKITELSSMAEMFVSSVSGGVERTVHEARGVEARGVD